MPTTRHGVGHDRCNLAKPLLWREFWEMTDLWHEQTPFRAAGYIPAITRRSRCVCSLLMLLGGEVSGAMQLQQGFDMIEG